MSAGKKPRTRVGKLVTKLRDTLHKTQPREVAPRNAVAASVRVQATSESAVEEIRHRAVIAGHITDAQSGEAIANALVEVADQNLKTQTQAEGFFYFLDLPPGQYTLTASAPHLISRYGIAAVDQVTVQNDAQDRPIFDWKANVGLPPTRLSGQVTRNDDHQPIAKAMVILRGSESKTMTDKDGKYVLSVLQAGKPTVQVSAEGFVAASQQVTLTTGQETIADFSLTKN